MNLKDYRIYTLSILMLLIGLSFAAYKVIQIDQATKAQYQSLFSMNCTQLWENFKPNAGTKLGDVLFETYVMKQCFLTRYYKT